MARFPPKTYRQAPPDKPGGDDGDSENDHDDKKYDGDGDVDHHHDHDDDDSHNDIGDVLDSTSDSGLRPTA